MLLFEQYLPYFGLNLKNSVGTIFVNCRNPVKSINFLVVSQLGEISVLFVLFLIAALKRLTNHSLAF